MAESTKIDDSESKRRTFLCVVDDSEELSRAVRFACRRAASTGGHIALLYVLEPAEFQHWLAVGELMSEERREEAEEIVYAVASVVQELTGSTPTIHIREGNITEALIGLLTEDAGIDLLVLGAATGQDGPGPLITDIVQKLPGRLPVPITIVPGNLTDEQIDAIS